MIIIFSKYFYPDRIYIQKLSKDNRDTLFVKVNQPELILNIFDPLENLPEYDSHFFGKRFAILGGFKIGKTELGKYIIHKMELHYSNCIALTINSKSAEYLSVKEIDDWIYTQWLDQLIEVENPEFKNIALKEIEKFKQERNYNPLDKSKKTFLHKIYLICRIYKNFLVIHPSAKFIVQFDQANVITDEAKFSPFYEFWRNFQGYWEDDNLFSELPIFVFVIGHKDWQNFAALKSTVGRGVFDRWVVYNYWNTIDIHQMFENRLRYAIRSKNLLKYFLCSGIIDFFGTKLGDASTQEYFDTIFMNYLQNFLSDFTKNKKEHKNFLNFCQRGSKWKKHEETYFQDVERIFSGTPASDYMPVFRYLSENQQEKWFNELFSLIQELYNKISIPFNSTGLKKYKNLTYKFISDNFSYDPKDGMRPNYNPPLFHDYGGRLALDRSFKDSLHVIPHSPKQGPVYRLKRFVNSDRIRHTVFNANIDEEPMKKYLNTIIDSANNIFYIVQKWVINEDFAIFNLNNYDLIPFDKIRKYTFELNELYKGKNTNWANFDRISRDLVNILNDKIFSIDTEIIEYLKELKNKALFPKSSNLSIIEPINSMILKIEDSIIRIDDILMDNKLTESQKLEALANKFKSNDSKTKNLALKTLDMCFREMQLPKDISLLSIKMKRIDNTFNIKNTTFNKFITFTEHLADQGYLELKKQENVILISKINYDKLIKKEKPITKKKVNKSISWKEIISKGESDKVELKSSLRYDYHQDKVNKELEFIIAKNIAAFLNTEGGKLFIGIDDNGIILGIKKDYNTLKKKNRDGFKLRLVELINNNLGKEFNVPKYLSIKIDEIDNKDICLIEISKSRKPVYLKGDIYIRTAVSTEKLNSKEAYEYIESHFNKE